MFGSTKLDKILKVFSKLDTDLQVFIEKTAAEQSKVEEAQQVLEDNYNTLSKDKQKAISIKHNLSKLLTGLEK